MILPRLAIKNAQFVLIIAILMVLVGIVSYLNMPRSEDPQFDIPINVIEIIYPGASPLDIETLVVDPLEEEISDIEGIDKIESQVKNDGARIEVTFRYGTDVEAVFNKVKLAVSTVEPDLPVGIQDILVLKATPTSVAIMQFALWSDPINYKQMEYYAKQLEKRLEAISSVRKADIWGYPQQIVAVDLNLELLKHYGISVIDIERILKGRAQNITPGFVDATTRRFNVKASGNFQELDTLDNTIVLSTDKFALKLKDVATVKFASREATYLAYYDSKPAIFITVEQRENSNIFDLTQQIDKEVERFTRSLPDNVKLETLFKQEESVNVRVNGFFENLWQGLILVGLMSFIFLGARESLVVLITIPLSFLVAITWLDFAGFGLQQMSIVGMIIALGLLVDDAIVVTESIQRRKIKHSSMDEAAIDGTSQVGWASISGTLTTMLAFLPMLMLASDTGDFIRSMPVTVVLVLFASLSLSLILIPLIASKFFKKETSNAKTVYKYINAFADGYYIRGLKTLVLNKWLVSFIAICALSSTLFLFEKVGVSLFPKAQKPMILLDILAPPNSSIDATDAIMQEVNQLLGKYPLIKKVALNVGNSNPRIYYNEIPKRGVVHFGQILVLLEEYEESKVQDLIGKLRLQFATWNKAKVTVKEFTQGPVTDQPITIRLIGNSLDDLEKVAVDLANKMSSTEGVINVNNPIGVANTELSLQIDYDKAGLSNIDVNNLDNTIQIALSGVNIGLFNDVNGEDYPIVVRREEPDLEGLANVHITNRQGQAIPLNQIVETKLQKGRTEFFHYQKLRMAKVSSDVDNGYSVNELTKKVISYLDNYDMPNGMYYIIGGEEESREASFAGLSQIMLITAVGIFAILVLQFKSILQPLIIFSSIPFAVAGAVLGLYLFNLSFSMMAFIGLISLFGIVVNNAIILIDTTNRNMNKYASKLEAILAASATRFTPILLTTLTTIGGLLPLTILGGSLWQPLGVVIISGLCVSAVSSFFLVPVLIEIFTKTSEKQ